eukprot:838370-Amphidinium_carterae.5
MAGHILDLGFERCEDMPCFFRHPTREYVIEIHQDDVRECADLDQLEWFKNEITKKGILFKWSSPTGQDNESYIQLKCKRSITPTSTWISGNSKYSQTILEELGLMNAKPFSTPLVSTRSPLSAEDTYRYRKCAGLLRFLRRRLGPLGTSSVQNPWQDWAGDKISRQSTSSCIIAYEGCNLVDSSKSQVPIATSSGEAEWYGACDCTSEAIFMHKGVEFIFNKRTRLVVFTDCTVFKSIGNSQGCGKIRHLETRSLLLQQWIESNRLYMASSIRPTLERRSSAYSSYR